MMRKNRVERSSGRDAGGREKFFTVLTPLVVRDEPAGGPARRKMIFATPLSAYSVSSAIPFLRRFRLKDARHANEGAGEWEGENIAGSIPYDTTSLTASRRLRLHVDL